MSDVSRRSFLIGASSVAIAVGAGIAPVPTTASAVRTTGRAIAARQSEFFAIVHPKMMDALQRAHSMPKMSLLNEFRKCGTPLFIGKPCEFNGIDLIE